VPNITKIGQDALGYRRKPRGQTFCWHTCYSHSS